MHPFALRRSFAAPLLSLTIAWTAAGCSAPATLDESSPRLGTAEEAVTAAEAISRAEEWVTAKLLYCQSPNGKSDAVDPACSPICMRQSDPNWDPYRSDCSGLVSWAWGLPAPGRTTAEFAPNQSDITHTIDASTLAMGDAVNTDDSASSEHHIMLFKAWTVPGQKATFIEEPGCSSNPNYAHEFTSAVTLNGTSIKVAYNGITFDAIRYGALTQSQTYAAKYVTQSWPLSSAPPIAMTAGVMQKGSIDMTNTGTATWAAGVVMLAPIPRDMPSPFHAPSWVSPTRVSTLSKDVPPGAVGHFEWDLDPSQPGTFMPYFGLVAEGITWFADSGGPPDDDLQVNVDVAPGAAMGAGGGSSSGGSSSGATTSSGSSSSSGSGSAGNGGAGGATFDGSASPGNDGGCQVSPGAKAPATALGWLTALLLLGMRSERSRRRKVG